MSFVNDLPRLRLAHVPTPLEPQPQLLTALLGNGAWPELWVKRDDLTGLSVTGNKVRKLELLVADAQKRGADTLITCGGVQSNHCRATAAVAAQLGLRSILFLRSEGPPPPPSGNLLLDRLLGAKTRFITRAQYQDRTRIMADAAAEVARSGRRAHVIPEGGSNGLGCLGYLRCIEELRAQVPNPHEPLTILSSVGSGGTMAGLLLGVACYGLPWRVVGVNVCDDRAHFVERITSILREASPLLSNPAAALLVAQAEGSIDLRDGYVGRGYALSQASELSLITAVAQRSGLLLDPVYTGKAFYGLVGELKQDPASLGSRVVFLHSGGVFGLLAAASELAEVLDPPKVRSHG